MYRLKSINGLEQGQNIVEGHSSESDVHFYGDPISRIPQQKFNQSHKQIWHVSLVSLDSRPVSQRSGLD